MNLKKGIIALLIFPLFIISMMPLSVHADSQIVPTLSSSAQTWVNNNGQIYVTNYCEGTTSSTNSCKLTFTTPSNFYGMIYFDGYDSNNTKWISSSVVFVADGQGEYNYHYWQSAQIVISKVNINIVNLVRPDSTVDLSQIIQLLTAIEQDTSSIDITLDNTLTQITNVLNQLIISNGYLDIISKYREFNFPIESFSAVSTAMSTLPVVDYFQYYSYIYPIFSIKQNDILFNVNVSANDNLYLVYFISGRIYQQSMSNYLEWSEGYTIKEYSFIRSGQYNGRNGTFYRVVVSWDTNGFKTLKYISTITNDFIPIYAYSNNGYVSTDFALLWGLNNRLLDDLHIIANGTNSSNSSVSSADQQNDTFKDQADDLVTQEQQFTSDMKQNLQQINTNFTFNNFGNKFMSSAVWVRDQYDHMITNTPFGSLVTFSLLLGLGLLIIGRTVNK